jgi:signal transduction histidine kinase
MFSRASTRIGLFALLLGVIVLSLFGSLIAADRALATADRESVDMDARAVALIVERELRLHAEALTHLDIASADTVPLAPFRATWLLDGNGRVIARRGAAVVDTARLVALSGATTYAAWPAVATAASSGENDGLLVAAPVSRGAAMSAVAVGLLSGATLLASVQEGGARRPWLALRVADQPVAVIGVRDRFETYLTAQRPLAIPVGNLAVEVAHAQSGRTLRTTLWTLGVVGLVALLIGLARERRQTMSLAGRTAELERLYQEVARSNRMKSEFLANVSHELRTPLNAVVGFVEMLREGVYGELSPRQALPVDRIAASATHLRHLVDRLLDIAKIAAGRLEVHPEPLVLRPFVLNVASEMESLVSERGLALSIGVGPSLPRIRTDQTHLRQILINLIGNAVKYTPSGGIQVRAKLVGNGAAPVPDESAQIGGAPPDPKRLWVALEVSDTGVGIAPADTERIFDEFEQVNAGARTDSARRGTGLGLAISRRLARLLGGELTVVSELGRGSVFTVWLPLEPTAADKAD